MRCTPSRRFALSAMAAVCLVPALLQPLQVAASSSGTLFGLVIGLASISKIDPVTGTLTTVASLPLPPGQPAPGYGTFMADDPTTHRVFFMQLRYDFSSFPPIITYQLLSINTQIGALVASAPLVHPLASLAFDPTSGTLFGVTSDCCPDEIVRVDPMTGAETNLVPVIGDAFSPIALAPASHTLYLLSETFGPQRTTQLLSMDTRTNAVTPGPILSTGARGLVYDTSSGALFATTFCCPVRFVRLDPVTGAETQLGNYDFGFSVEPGIAIDSATHTVFVVQDVFDIFTGPIAHIASINDQTGAGSLGASTGQNVAAIAFEPVLITPQSIQVDVKNALASGAIGNVGLAESLLAELRAAAAARSRGHCKPAGNIYQAFVNELEAQSGKLVAAGTATQLISEAQFLIANCP